MEQEPSLAIVSLVQDLAGSLGLQEAARSLRPQKMCRPSELASAGMSQESVATRGGFFIIPGAVWGCGSQQTLRDLVSWDPYKSYLKGSSPHPGVNGEVRLSFYYLPP